MTLTTGERPNRIRIAFIVTGLAIGGAEIMLWKLLSRIDRALFEPVVIALSANVDPALRGRFIEAGVECHLLGLRPLRDAVSGLVRLRRLLRSLQPDIVQGWMYHGNLAATLAALAAPRSLPVLWNVRCTPMSGEKWLSSSIAWLVGRLSFSPRWIINNSMASAVEHERRHGYPPRKRVILPNGFDTNVFKPSDEARAALRAALGLPAGTVVVGLFGRYHPMKDHAGFLAAAALLAERHPDVHCVLAGDGVDASNSALNALVERGRLTGRVHLLGLRRDMERLMPAADIAVSSSRYGEGFPNVIGEAMSCGVPCVVTDVGDSAWIVGDTGRVVRPGDAHALAAAVSELVAAGEHERTALGARARRRIVENFALDKVVRSYEEIYLSVSSHLAPIVEST